MVETLAQSDGPPPPARKIPKNKKTRELPNLSDCHCCNRHINNTNPKDRLQTLTSEWRIVLLCKECLKRVESAQTCSYCLGDVLTKVSTSASAAAGIDSTHQCPKCKRRIHQECVSRYSTTAPWSYLPDTCDHSSNRFDLCIDCWVPKLIEDEINRRFHRRKSKRKVNFAGEACSIGSSRASDDQPKVKPLEAALEEAHCLAKKKLAAATEAKEKALTKALAARQALELAAGALDLFAASREEKKDDFDEDELGMDDDARLAFQLHRAINSSPRIINSLCLSDTDCRDLSKVMQPNCDLSLKPLAVYESRRKGKLMNVRDEINLNGEAGSPQEQKKLNSIESENNCLKKYESNGGKILDHRCNDEHDELDRYVIKYRRRSSESSHCRYKILYDRFDLDCRAQAPAIPMNYSEKSRPCADAS